MNRALLRTWAILTAVLSAAAVANAAPLGTAFTYQGQLTQGGVPVATPVLMEFTVWSDPVSTLPSDLIGGMPLIPVTPDANGLFTQQLNFGANVFNGQARWLQIAISPTGVPPLTTLWPRQELTPAPHALALPGLYTEENGTSPNIIGGHQNNSVAVGVFGATISGGGSAASPNSVAASFGNV